MRMKPFSPWFSITGPLFLTVFLLCLPLSAVAAEGAAGSAVVEGARDAANDKASGKAALKTNATSIAVEHKGTDTIGIRLAYQLKEIFNASTLFALNDKDAPKLIMLITTESEFPDRPSAGSIYSVIWVYSEGSNMLGSYLAHEIGVATRDEPADLAARLAERSSGLAARHSYIFKK